MYALIALAETVIIILLGGLSLGAARKLSARMQRRRGPSIFQAFYDVSKFFSKELFYSKRLPVVYAVSSMAFQIAAVFILIYGGDTMMAFFVPGRYIWLQVLLLPLLYIHGSGEEGSCLQ